MDANNGSLEALLPAEMAVKAEQIGVKKANQDATNTFVLAVLAGAFVALGAIFSTTVTAGTSAVQPYGIVRLLFGLVFTLGLILVIVGGAELFTGNNMIVMAWASRKVSLRSLLRNWLIVFVGNFVGSVLTALVIFESGQYAFGGGVVGASALTIANAKVNLDFGQAIALGMSVQRACLSGRLADLQCADDDRPHRGDNATHHGVCRRRFRAQRGQHVLHPDWFADQAICVAGILVEHRQVGSGLPQPDGVAILDG